VRFLEARFPAVRVTEAHAACTRQRQDLRVENGNPLRRHDRWRRLRQSGAGHLAQRRLAGGDGACAAPPTGVAIESAVTPHTRRCAGRRRRARPPTAWGGGGHTAPQWTQRRDVPAAAGPAQTAALRHTAIDDWVSGVSALSADGHESPVVFRATPDRSDRAGARLRATSRIGGAGSGSSRGLSFSRRGRVKRPAASQGTERASPAPRGAAAQARKGCKHKIRRSTTRLVRRFLQALLHSDGDPLIHGIEHRNHWD
jgi:hypothetical protein